MLLHRADAVDGIKDDDLCVINILEAFECRLAGIAGGSDQNDSVLAVVGFLEGFCQQMRKDLQRHILKGTGGTMPQFKNIQRSAVELGICHRGRISASELFSGICFIDAFFDFLCGKIG